MAPVRHVRSGGRVRAVRVKQHRVAKSRVKTLRGQRVKGGKGLLVKLVEVSADDANVHQEGLGQRTRKNEPVVEAEVEIVTVKNELTVRRVVKEPRKKRGNETRAGNMGACPTILGSDQILKATIVMARKSGVAGS
jgi:hypothetical protein